MNGQLAQLITFVSYGNVYLRSGVVDLSNLSTFDHVSELRFIMHENENDDKGMVITNNLEDWFFYLRHLNATRLWNISFEWGDEKTPEHFAAAFSNGIPMAIQVDLKHGMQYWIPKWYTGGPKNKPWHINYHGFPLDKSFPLPDQDIHKLKQQLNQALSKAIAFAIRPDVKMSGWAKYFEEALILLESSAPIPPYYPDILPTSNFSLEARQLMAASMKANVFGGMGSWNDVWITDDDIEKEYKKVSIELYAAIKSAAVIASNAF